MKVNSVIAASALALFGVNASAQHGAGDFEYKGIGLGASEAQVRAKYPTATCRTVGRIDRLRNCSVEAGDPSRALEYFDGVSVHRLEFRFADDHLAAMNIVSRDPSGYAKFAEALEARLGKAADAGDATKESELIWTREGRQARVAAVDSDVTLCFKDYAYWKRYVEVLTQKITQGFQDVIAQMRAELAKALEEARRELEELERKWQDEPGGRELQRTLRIKWEPEPTSYHRGGH